MSNAQQQRNIKNRLDKNDPGRCPRCGRVGSLLRVSRSHYDYRTVRVVRRVRACVSCDVVFSEATTNAEKIIINVSIDELIGEDSIE